jgi:hypothetical protein
MATERVRGNVPECARSGPRDKTTLQDCPVAPRAVSGMSPVQNVRDLTGPYPNGTPYGTPLPPLGSETVKL